MLLPYPGTIGARNYYQDTEMVALINKCGIHKINSNDRSQWATWGKNTMH